MWTMQGKGDQNWTNFMAHRVTGGQKIELLVHWEGTTSAQDTWEPLESFIQVKGPRVLQYCKDQGLGVDLDRLGEAQ